MMSKTARWVCAAIGIGIAWLAIDAPAWGLELDERPAVAGDWGYRPAADLPPAHNPPAFCWRPVKDAASYVLEVAADAEFSEPVYRMESLPWSSHCPPRAFPPGTYYWRYAARDESGEQTAWSQIRSFEVTADAPEIPQPTIEELVERMPKTHPRLFFRPEDVPRLRSLAAGPLAQRWEELVASADELLANPPDTTEPPKYPEGMERGSGEWKKIWWGNRLYTIKVADSAATLAFVYRIGGEERYGRAARDLLMALCEWDPRGATGFAYNDEAAMPVLYMASRAYTWAYPILDDADREAIVAMMRIRGGDVFAHLTGRNHLWRPYASHSNRSWHFLGELSLAFYDDIPEAARWLDYAMTIFYTAYPVWGDADGGWHEGSAYWNSYNNRFMWWAAVARSAFGIDVFQRPFYRRTGYFPLYVMPPGTRTGGFGDQAESLRSEQVANLVAVLAAGARNPHWKWYADNAGGDLGGGYLGFLHAVQAGDLEAAPPADLPQSVCFHGTGVAALNSNLLDGRDNVQILFKSSPMGTQSHGYNSNNSFLLNIGGERVFRFTGRRDVYGSPHHRDWMWETKSGNAILVNGKGQKKHSADAKGRINSFSTSDEVDTIEGETWDPDSGLVGWRRRIVFLKPDVVVMHDVLDAAEPSTFQWLLHAKGPFDLGRGEAVWTGDPGRVRVRWLEPTDLAITQTDRYDVPPAEWTGWDLGEWHLTADAREPAAHREFVTVINVGYADPRVSMERDDDGARVLVTRPSGTVEVWLGAEEFGARLAATAPEPAGD